MEWLICLIQLILGGNTLITTPEVVIILIWSEGQTLAIRKVVNADKVEIEEAEQ
jgi:hypothetical protein